MERIEGKLDNVATKLDDVATTLDDIKNQFIDAKSQLDEGKEKLDRVDSAISTVKTYARPLILFGTNAVTCLTSIGGRKVVQKIGSVYRNAMRCNKKTNVKKD